LQAKIVLEYADIEKAEAVAKAISPDNDKVPAGLIVKTVREQKNVVTDITLDGKLTTLIATIDDLLENASTAEKTLNVAKKK
jgi:hypothetical protein